MIRRRPWPIEATVGLYLVAYVPSILVTKLVTSKPLPVLGRPPTGLETLPASLIVSLVLTYLFIWISGWHNDAHHRRVLGLRVPVPTKWTFLSGIGTALILFTVPLSFTFEGVSIPFIQLLMRGDILIIAPLVDLMFGRRVRWWSWAALAMVFAALAITLGDRGGLKLPPVAILTIVLYTIGYFVRLAVMTRIAKDGDPRGMRQYFVEEKIVALPLSVAALAVLAGSGIGGQANELGWGFVGVWGDPVIVPLFAIGLTLTIISVIAIVILLDPRENAYCVPLERAASLVAGVAAALLLAWFWGLPTPRPAELLGAGILIAAIALLSLAPRFDRRERPAGAGE